MEETPVKPKVSAVIVSHNSAKALRRALAALEKSKHREQLEILVVDCGSTDESPRLDDEFPAVTILRLPHHFGATKAMNIGIRTAKGEFIFLLDPEVEVGPETVPKLLGRLESDTDVLAACPLLVDPDGQPASRVFRLPTPQSPATLVGLDLNQETIAVEYPGRSALLVRRQFIQGMNYLDDRYGHYWADADLAMQVRRAQKRICIFPAIRAVLHPSKDPFAGDARFEADRELGLAVFLGKYYGFLTGLRFRLGAILRALGRFEFSRLSSLVSGQKVDGANPA